MFGESIALCFVFDCVVVIVLVVCVRFSLFFCGWSRAVHLSVLVPVLLLLLFVWCVVCCVLREWGESVGVSVGFSYWGPVASGPYS
jgi:hypothetical protein